MSVRAGVGGGGGAPGSFLTMQEAGLVEMANMDMHEKFLCRLTVSSLTLPSAVQMLLKQSVQRRIRIRVSEATGVMQSALIDFFLGKPQLNLLEDCVVCETFIQLLCFIQQWTERREV